MQDKNVDSIKNICKIQTSRFTDVEIINMDSIEAAKKFKDRSIDFVYIDAEHIIPSVAKDIVAWLPKAKKFLGGHDYLTLGSVKTVVDYLTNVVTYGDIWTKKIYKEDW
jgi:hypothetical protein